MATTKARNEERIKQGLSRDSELQNIEKLMSLKSLVRVPVKSGYADK